MADRLTDDEKRAIEQANGKVVKVPTHTETKTPPRVDWDAIPRCSKPRGPAKGHYALPREMSVRAALEWAFATEKASFEYDEIAASSGGVRSGISMEAILQERAKLGGVQIDTSPGRSLPAEEADIIASVLRSVLPWHQAIWIAELARLRREPNWMRDATPRLVPVDWVWGRGGKRGRTADSHLLGADGWQPVKRRSRKGGIISEPVLFTPCTMTPTFSQIAAARREYLEWYGCLLELQVHLRAAGLRRFTINNQMPPLRPWSAG